MKRNLILHSAQCLVVFLVSVDTPLAAQDKPDFSGSWVLESGPSSGDIPRSLSVKQTVIRTNVRGEPIPPSFKDLKVTPALEGGTDSATYQLGIVGGTTRSEGPQTHFCAAWEAQTLVIERGTYTGQVPESGEWTERREVWSLDESGRLHLTITTRSPAAAVRTVMLVYRRQR